jgi:hypothetical protein
MTFVSDSTPLIALSRIHRLEILQQICGTILIPEEVYEEVVTRGGSLYDAEAVSDAPWISVVPVVNKTAVNALYLTVDRDEAEAIILAKENDALLIIDDKDGRNAALALDLQITGTIGILLLAAEEDSLTSAKNFWHLKLRVFEFWIQSIKRSCKNQDSDNFSNSSQQPYVSAFMVCRATGTLTGMGLPSFRTTSIYPEIASLIGADPSSR